MLRLNEPVTSTSSFFIQSANQDPACDASGASRRATGSALAPAAFCASIAPRATIASRTIATRCCAASGFRIGLYSEGALIRPASIAASESVSC
jgi:hypothetical protein